LHLEVRLPEQLGAEGLAVDPYPVFAEHGLLL
jgi:hypothetical protein